MRILVASTVTPLVDGGARKIASDLTQVLRERGHEAEQLLFPFSSDPEWMLEQMLAIRLTDVSEACDLLIALRTPIYLLRHPRKVLWFLHHHRGAYDLWGTPLGDIPDTDHGRRLRRAFIAADDRAFAEARSIHAISGLVAERMRVGNGVSAGVLYPPLVGEPPPAQAAGSYLFMPSRIAGNKRQRLAVEAMAHVRCGVRLVIAGSADTPGQLAELQELVAAQDGRVELIPRWIEEREKRELMAGSVGVLYVPYEEDYGYVALEALQAGKPVITCSDSGGPLELIVHGRHGFVTEPTPQALAEAIDRLAGDPALAARLGEEARRRPAELGISWDRVVEALLA